MKWIIKKDSSQTSYSAVKSFILAEKVNRLSVNYTMHQPTWLRFLLFDEKGILRAQKSGIAATGSIELWTEDSSEQNQPVITEATQLSLHSGDLNTLPGSIETGEWRIEYFLSISSKQEGQEAIGEIEIKTIADESFKGTPHRPYEVGWSKKGTDRFQLDEKVLTRTLETGSRWYKGDFHTHTVFSDGKMTREMNLEQAAKQNLDFFVATDHDLMPTSWPLSHHCLVLPGVEVTSRLGHYNRLFGLTHPYQEKGYTVLKDASALVDSFGKSSDETHLNSVNHPFLTEWKWLAEDLPINKIDSLEIWNDPTYEANPKATEQALKAWDVLLRDGYRMPGIGGSDSHLLPVETYPESPLPSLIGDPATYVWADALSGEALKKSVASGKIFVSRFNYEVDLTVNGGMIGDHFTDWNETVEATCSVQSESQKDKLSLEWIVDGKVVAAAQNPQDRQSFTLDPSEYHYVRVNIRKTDGTLLAFTNPVFFGEKEPELSTWKDVLERV